MFLTRSIFNRTSFLAIRSSQFRCCSNKSSVESPPPKKPPTERPIIGQLTEEQKKIVYQNYQANQEKRKRSKDIALYGFTVVLLAIAMTYASVPIYRIYCQATGKGGKARIADDFLANKVRRMKKNKEKLINVTFIADKEARMRWNFKPTQEEIKVYPGATALAFFTARNPTDKPVSIRASESSNFRISFLTKSQLNRISHRTGKRRLDLQCNAGGSRNSSEQDPVLLFRRTASGAGRRG